MQQLKSSAAKFLAATFVLASLTASSQATPFNAGGVITETVNKSCPAATGCYIKFSAVPQPVQVSRVSCNFYLSVGNQGVQVTGSEAGLYSGLKYYLSTYLNTIGAFPSAYNGTTTQFQFLSDVMYGIPANDRPAIHIGYNQQTDGTFTCTISYTLMPAS